jgi:hypothetical protein
MVQKWSGIDRRERGADPGEGQCQPRPQVEHWYVLESTKLKCAVTAQKRLLPSVLTRVPPDDTGLKEARVRELHNLVDEFELERTQTELQAHLQEDDR